ncbi:tellurite resistance methyltransferase TehB [Oceaniglobus indicus]|uniref:tellurite resistance methyltransferase TehB n=1 Tax=Oceaniglobus indicus TaxID=2047749 RepID=UPI000C1752C7|nr:tellurite resistance methyltransferase TehB [Oceaniglobus indicus]
MTDLNRRHGLNPPHSEVVNACQHIAPCDALDMGCSNGRNALYLGEQGFNVTAVDSNANAIGMLQSIVAQEGIGNVDAQVYDINQAALQADFGFISCTVTLMFLDPGRVETVIADMQAHTVPGGANLIVCAMDTTAHPCPIAFPFTLNEGQLGALYQGWEMLKYNEDLGTMHNGAQLQFATMLARKPA